MEYSVAGHTMQKRVVPFYFHLIDMKKKKKNTVNLGYRSLSWIYNTEASEVT